MAICLNPMCQKTVADDSIFCAYCGGRSISKIQSFASIDQIPDEISIENFEKIINSTPPVQDRVGIPITGKGSIKSRIAVRMQYIKRKIFFRRKF